MIPYKLDENDEVLTVRPEGKLETQDFLTLSEVVDAAIVYKDERTKNS